MSTPAEKVHAQSGALIHDKGTKNERWWQRHLIGPVELKQLIEDADTLDRIRAHFQYGANEEAWPPGIPIDEAVGKIIAELDALAIQHGTCSVCGKIAWEERCKMQHCLVCELRAERDALAKRVLELPPTTSDKA